MIIKFRADPNYQKEQFLNGHEIRPEYALDLTISSLQRDERQLILDTYFKDTTLEEFVITLQVPFYNPTSNEIQLVAWLAKINPDAVGVQGVAHQWLDDFKQEEEKAIAEFENQ